MRANSYSHSVTIGSLIAETTMNREFGEDSESVRAITPTIHMSENPLVFSPL